MNTAENKYDYCCPTPTDKETFQKEAVKPLKPMVEPPKTSDLFSTCNLPARFEHPHWFNGYGTQTNKQHPFYRTTSSEYGWFPPGYHSVQTVYFPMSQKFWNHLANAGMYKNYSLNTAMEKSYF